jgi:hypothetical protein
MGISLRDRLRAGLGSAEEWGRDREADLAHGEAELMARGHQLYGQAIRNGQEALVRTTSELRELAKRQSALLAPGTRSPQPPAAQRPPVQQSNSRPTLDRDQQILENARRIVAQTQRRGQQVLERVVQSQPVRKVAGDAARTAGNAAGVVTGAVHLGHNVLDTAVLAARLQNPIFDLLAIPAGETAISQVVGVERGMYKLGRRIATAPQGVAHDVAEKTRDLVRDTVPLATPEAPTLAGEVRRNFHIGRRQGEIGIDIAPYFVGAGEVKGMADLRALARANSVDKYLQKGFPQAKAARLSRLYNGMGDHAFIKRGARLPRWLGGGLVPKEIVDSPFNVQKPPGISFGDMYELHFKGDPQMFGARLPGGGRGWSGRKLGLQKYEGPARLWFRTPSATKRAIAGVGVIGTIPFDGDEGE